VQEQKVWLLAVFYFKRIAHKNWRSFDFRLKANDFRLKVKSYKAYALNFKKN
jgi:hypothetical protein